ncbi:MAG: hypothetical protein FWD75_03085 [Propionibacteriaceae bacterium]|nr:hypothetical protein [Propionibacteriaceae bacterium]
MPQDHSLLNEWASAHTALLVEGQSRLSRLVGSDVPDWELSLATGFMTLNHVRVQFALLGHVDEETNTWVWSWADPHVDHTAIAVRRAEPLREFGAEAGLWEFTEPSFPMDGVLNLGMTPGATLAVVASPQIMGGAIFSGWRPGRRLYAVITDPRLTMEAPTAFTVPRIISSALSYGLGDHKDIVTVYASAHQIAMEESRDEITLVFEDEARLSVMFDDRGRIRHMHGTVPSAHGDQAAPAPHTDVPALEGA